MSDLTLAIIQSDIHWEKVDANLAMFEEKIWELEESVDLILLPETFNAGFSSNLKLIAEVPGLKTQKWMLQMARQKKAMIGGSYLVNEGGKLYNRFLLAKPDGSIESNDKRHLFNLSEIEIKLTPSSNRNIVEFKGWKICPMICYDLRFPAWSRNHVKSSDDQPEYDLLIYVANWPKPRIDAWDALLKARAIENQSYVAGVNRVGIDGSGHEYTGHSSVYSYEGKELSFLNKEEGFIIQNLSKSALDEFRKKLPFLKDADSLTFNPQ
ncbi:MAG: nitrilase family protein [Reichenbachiella sp.]